MALTNGLKTKSLSKVRAEVTDIAAKEDLVRFNFYIDKAKLKALKTEALDLNVSVADLVREALDARASK